MDDLISRQAAIDAIKVLPKWPDAVSAVCLDYADVMSVLHDIEKLPSAQLKRKIPNNKVHLCNSCQHTYVTCPSHGADAVFGDGTGNDNICACSQYLPIAAQPERPKGRWIPVDSYSAFGGDEATWMAYGNPVAFYYCSECKEQAYAGEDGESLITDYCPNCGANMRGEE